MTGAPHKDPRSRATAFVSSLPPNPRQDDFAFAGKVSASFDTEKLIDLRARLDAIETYLSPFTVGTAFPRTGVHWVRPAIVVQVAFIEWTRHGKLRRPRVLDMRFDKVLSNLRRARPATLNSIAVHARPPHCHGYVRCRRDGYPWLRGTLTKKTSHGRRHQPW